MGTGSESTRSSSFSEMQGKEQENTTHSTLQHGAGESFPCASAAKRKMQ